jgi:hypothetical protein
MAWISSCETLRTCWDVIKTENKVSRIKFFNLKVSNTPVTILQNFSTESNFALQVTMGNAWKLVFLETGWSTTCYVALDDLELAILLTPPPGAGMTGTSH